MGRRSRRRAMRVARLAVLAFLLVALAVGLGYLVGKDKSGSRVYVNGTTGGVAGASTSSAPQQRPAKKQQAKKQQPANAKSHAQTRLATRSGDDVLAQRSLAALAGRYVTARKIVVRQVVGDEEFWVGRSPAQRVLVHLQSHGESHERIRRGERVSFVGVVARNAPGLAATWGIVGSEGAALLNRQGAHVVASAARVRVSH